MVVSVSCVYSYTHMHTSTSPQPRQRQQRARLRFLPGRHRDSTVADLAVVLRPRYHFAARPGAFFQRAPYRNHASKPTSKMSHVTRFISLAPVSEDGVGKKRKGGGGAA